ncbi:MAG TPA: secretin N-terminal domain-containing protein, partial [Deinococcales bacterium]|nr:secretin N-terminal domain-containing protein [Deinococcales bacterium]
TAALRAAGEPPSTGEKTNEFYQVQGDAEDLADLLDRAVPGITVEVLGGVRTLLVSGSASEHERVSELLTRFDVPPVEVEFRTYRLSNAEAEELADVLNDSQAALFRAASREADEENGDDDSSADEPLDEEQQESLFTVSADSRTNSLIVTAPASVQRQVETLIDELDLEQRQVNVQVRLQEIQTRTADELGINIAGGVGRFSTSILDGGLRFLFDPHGAVSAFNIGAVLDSLETQGLSRRVDDSSLTVLNNNETSIQAGGTILVTLAGQAENIERTIPYGVQIDVTPRVSNDDRVTLEIMARVEDLLSSTNDPSMLELSTRAVRSTVTIERGQTILLSGLMQNQYTETVNKVPLLGDLPLVGGLFRSTLAELSETELLIIVTADVLD